MKRLLVVLFIVILNTQAQVYFYEPFEYDSITEPSSPWTEYSNVSNIPGVRFEWKTVDKIEVKYGGYTTMFPGVLVNHYHTLGRGKFLTPEYKVQGSPSIPFTPHLILESDPIYIPPSASTPIYLTLIASFYEHNFQNPDTVLIQVYDGNAWQTVINLAGNSNKVLGTNWLPIKDAAIFNADITNYWNPGLKVRIYYARGMQNFVGLDEIIIHSESVAELSAMKTFIASNNQCPFSNNEHVAILLRNKGPNTAYNIKLYYQLYKDSVAIGAPVMEIMDSLKAYRDSIYVFDTTINTSQPGKYYFKTWVESDNYDFTPFDNYIWSQTYSLYKITAGKYYYEPFDEITMVDFAREWEGNYESPYHFHEGGEITGLDTSAWVLHGGAYHYNLDLGPFQDVTNPDTPRIFPPYIPEVGKYVTIGHYYTSLYISYVPQVFELSSPCFLIDSSMGGFWGTYFYHINSDNVAKMSAHIYSADSNAIYPINSLLGRQQASPFDPWKMYAFHIDTITPIGNYYLPKNKSTIIKLGFTVERAAPVDPNLENFPVVAIDAVALGDLPTDINVFSVNVDGCVTGQDSLFIIFQNKYFYLRINQALPFIYEITVTGPTGVFTYRDTIYTVIPDYLAPNISHFSKHLVEPGELFLAITEPVFDFSIPGTYSYVLKWWHPQDNPNPTFLPNYLNYTPNSVADTINIHYLKPIEPIDFSKWTSPFIRINNFYPSWNSGQHDLLFGDKFPASIFIEEDIRNYSNYPSVMRDFWTFSHNPNNDTCAAMYMSLNMDKNVWLLSEPIRLPLTTAPIKLTYDIAMKPQQITPPNAPIELWGAQSFSVKIFPECGNHFNTNFDITDTLRLYDSTTVNNTPLATTLRTGLTDTIDISYYSGQKVIVGFNAISRDMNNPNKGFFVFLDNINILVPNTDFSPIALANIPDTICPGTPITNATVTIHNYGNNDMSPDFKVVYDGKEITVAGNVIINVGNSMVFTLPKIVFSSTGPQTIKVIIATPYDTVKSNDTIYQTIYVTPSSYTLVYDSDTLIVGGIKCIDIPEGVCDSVNWSIPTPLNVISGGTTQDASVCFTTNVADTVVIINVSRSCNGCEVEYNVPIFVVDQTVNLNSDVPLEVKVYPNPVNEILIIETPHEARLKVLNLYGQVLLSQQVKRKTEISFLNFPKGMYIVEIIYGEGPIYKKIMKE